MKYIKLINDFLPRERIELPYLKLQFNALTTKQPRLKKFVILLLWNTCGVPFFYILYLDNKDVTIQLTYTAPTS